MTPLPCRFGMMMIIGKRVILPVRIKRSLLPESEADKYFVGQQLMVRLTNSPPEGHVEDIPAQEFFSWAHWCLDGHAVARCYRTFEARRVIRLAFDRASVDIAAICRLQGKSGMVSASVIQEGVPSVGKKNPEV